MVAQLAPRVVQRLVQRAAVRVQPLGENIDRYTVDRKRDEDTPLVRSQHLGDRVLEAREQLILLGLRLGLEARAREEPPAFRLERDLAALPRALAQLDRCLEQGELVDPRREAAGAA